MVVGRSPFVGASCAGDPISACHTDCGVVQMKRYVVLSDIQIPFQDDSALEVAYKLIKDVKPDGVLLNGDIVDCYSISDFDKDPYSQAALEAEIAGACMLMQQLVKVPNKVWIGGNHEDRWRRVIWKQGSPYRSMFRSFQEAFQMDDYGFRWRPYGDYVLLGKLMVTHGSMVSKHSGQTAKAHYDKYGRSVLVGHTHRLGAYYHRNMEGTYAAFENGCLCSLTPEYTQHPNWQQGFSVVEVGDGGLFHVTQCPIIRGTSCFYGAKHYSI